MNRHMKIINQKKIDRLQLITLLSSVGAFWLSFQWFYYNNQGGDFIGSDFPLIQTFRYYLFNSFLLLLLYIFLVKKFYKIHGYLSVLLTLSVLFSLFMFPSFNFLNIFSYDISYLISVPFTVKDNLFFETVGAGIMYFIYGGPILIPLFFVSIFKNVRCGILYLLGKLEYSNVNEIEKLTDIKKLF